MAQKMKYPDGVQSFEKLRQENHTYVDKTRLVYDLAQRACASSAARAASAGRFSSATRTIAEWKLK